VPRHPEERRLRFGWPDDEISAGGQFGLTFLSKDKMLKDGMSKDGMLKERMLKDTM
jgi:pentapeptide MXKDX repeat protein